MTCLSNGVLVAMERGENPEMIEEMKRQALRVGKMFGYESCPGLFTINGIV